MGSPEMCKLPKMVERSGVTPERSKSGQRGGLLFGGPQFPLDRLGVLHEAEVGL